MKFKDDWDEHAFRLTLDDGPGHGDVSAPFGWFSALTLQPDNDGPSIIEHYGTPYLIVHESAAGFVTVLPFEKQTERDRRIKDLEQAHALHEAEVSDDQIKEAIENYLSAAMFTATDGFGDPLEGQGVQWGPDAQVQARDEVIDFVTQNIEEIRAFMTATGHGWAQVGIDFSLTRNGHGAGFWDRGAGEPGVALTESSKAWGEILVVVNSKGQVDFA